MVWRKGLAKLRQSLKADERGPQAPSRVLGAAPVPAAVPKTLEEEDNLFLTTVGKPRAGATGFHVALDGSSEFAEAMSGLKGLKSKAQSHAVPTESTKEKEPTAAAESAKTRELPTASSAQSLAANNAPTVPADLPDENKETSNNGRPAKVLPEKIQLAAGMTIEIDGAMDLRHHNAKDAKERLIERVLDGAALGWRSMHVILGNSDALHQVFLDYINSPQSQPLTKYAQAPVPMGGANAWILYYGTHANKEN